MSQSVKKRLADSLEQLMETQSLPKITISNIVAVGKLSRQSFYNNFLDIYDLIQWTHAEHIQHAIDLFWENEDFCESFKMALLSLQEHKSFYQNVIQKDNGLFFRDSFALRQVDLCNVHIKQIACKAPDPDTDFLLKLYWYGTADMLVQWISKGMKEDPAVLAQLFYKGLPVPLQKYWPKI